MRSTRQPPLQFTFGRDPSREQRALLPQQPLAPCALSRFNLRPATVAFGRGAAPGYACLASQHHDESGDEEEGAVLPQRNCQRCCLFLCVLALMAGGTSIVLRFLLARDSHPSSPAAKLAAAKLGVAPSRRPTTTKPPTVRAVATRPTPRVVAVPALRRSPPPPSPQRLGSEVFLIQAYAPPPSPPPGVEPRSSPPPEYPRPYLKVPPPPPPWPPWPPVGLSPHPPPPPRPPIPKPPPPPLFLEPFPPAPPPPPWPSVSSPPNPSSPSPPWPPDPPTFAAWLGARAANLTIPAVAARVEARKRRAKNQTRV